MRINDLLRGKTFQDVDREALEKALRLPVARMMGGSRMLGYFSTTVAASPALAAETVICTTQPFNPPVDADIVFVVGWASFTIGTAGVSSDLRIRYGNSTSGTLIADSGALSQTAAK